MLRYQLSIQSQALTLKDISSLIGGHHFGENRSDITVVLDRADTLEFLKDINTELYSEVSIETEGEYTIVTSIVDRHTAFFAESITDGEGILKYHETDILILPHYLPLHIKNHLIYECDSYKTIELTLGDVYKSLVEIIEHF